MLIAEFSMYPLDKGDSLSEYVAGSLDIVDRSGLPYRLGPMGTAVEGEWDEVMGVIRACYERMRKDCRRIECVVKIDAREGKGGRLSDKVQSVEAKLGRPLNR